MVSKKSKFGIGLVLGALGGALAGLFLAPKSGKQTQSEAKRLIKSSLKKLHKRKK